MQSYLVCRKWGEKAGLGEEFEFLYGGGGGGGWGEHNTPIFTITFFLVTLAS